MYSGTRSPGSELKKDLRPTAKSLVKTLELSTPVGYDARSKCPRDRKAAQKTDKDRQKEMFDNIAEIVPSIGLTGTAKATGISGHFL
jgi:hypothetical protein